jgi:hypothetical protein
VKRVLVAVLLAAGGCDRAFGLVRDPTTMICGPYGVPEPVAFSEALLAAGVRDFSVDATGQLGMVWANLGSGTIGAWRGPHAIKLDGNGVWVQDLARDQQVLNSLDGAHIQFDGSMAIGWTDVPRGATLREYTFVDGPMKWAQGAEQIENVLTVSAHVGNTIATEDGILRHLVEILIPDRAPFENTVQIYEKFGGMPWALTPQGNLLRTAKPPLNINGAVLTMAHDRMVYTANAGNEKVDGELVYRIYAGQRTRDQYEPGGEIDIDGIDSPFGFSEPWIDADCSTLYYRQDDVTWKTTMVTP